MIKSDGNTVLHRCFYCDREVNEHYVLWFGRDGYELRLHMFCALNLTSRLTRSVRKFFRDRGVKVN